MKPYRLIGMICWSVTTSTAFSNGFYIPVQAPEATGRGNAWLATADTASAVYYNAAGLTQLDSTDLVVGVYSIRLGIEAETPAGTYDNDASWAFIPQIYGAVPINDRLVAGFGINTPFGLATDWADTSPFSPLAIETQLDYVTGWAVAGYKVTDEFSVGGGLGVHHADASFKKTPIAAVDFSKFEGSDESLSWTVSARWQPAEEHSFGLVYRSKTDFTLSGDATTPLGSESARMNFLTPATLAAGYAFHPCDKWTFEANVEQVYWDEMNTLTVSKASADIPLTFDWESNLIYSVGVTRFLDCGWSISAGYNYIENSQPDANFNPGISDANRHWLNAGVSRQWERSKVNFAYQFAFSDRDVNGSPFGLADGTYKSRFHGLMLNCEWQF